MKNSLRLRIPLLFLGMLSLLLALWGGLVRMGWEMPTFQPRLGSFHGALMVSGFLGTLISLEKAAALEQRWTYAAPLFFGVGALSLIAELPLLAGQILMTSGSFMLAVVFAYLFDRQRTLFSATMGLGALSLFIGNLLWMWEWPVVWIALWWAGFPILVIAGERLELARLLHLPPLRRAAFTGATSLFIAGLILSLYFRAAGTRLAGIGMILISLWLLRHDMAWRTVRQKGLPRFMASCLLSGYFWLGVAGGLSLYIGEWVPGSSYDAILHCLFLGFTFSMIFGHAPVIFPAILGVRVGYTRRFYIPLVLLHLTLALRVVSDLIFWHAGRQWGGLLNTFTLLIFLGNLVYTILQPPQPRS